MILGYTHKILTAFWEGLGIAQHAIIQNIRRWFLYETMCVYMYLIFYTGTQIWNNNMQ